MTNTTITDNNIVEIELCLIENKKLNIKCNENEALALQESAALVRKKIAEVKNTIKFASADKLSQIAALNIAYELIQSHKKQEQMNQNIDNLIQKINNKNQLCEN